MTATVIFAAATLLAGIATAITVASQVSLLMLSASRVHRLADQESPASHALGRLVEVRHRLRAVAALFWGATASLATVTSGAYWLWLSARAADLPLVDESSVMGGSVVSTLSFLVLVTVTATVAVALCYVIFQTVPRAFAVANPEFLVVVLAPIALAITSVVSPISSVLSSPAKFLITAAGGERRVPVWAVTPEAASESDAGSDQQLTDDAFLEAVSGFGDKVVREVMTPRTDMFAIEDTQSVRDAVEVVVQTGVSRIPLFHDTLDDIRGIVYAKDLLRLVAADDLTAPLASIAKEVMFVPETKSIRDLLVEMRNRAHLAIVADEYGGTSGLVTLEDVIEEIVGDISDEYDVEVAPWVDLGEGSYRVDGRTSVDELNDLVGTDFQADADSVGGLFVELSGQIPQVDDSLVVDGLVFTVVAMDSNRVASLEVRRQAAGASRDTHVPEISGGGNGDER